MNPTDTIIIGIGIASVILGLFAIAAAGAACRKLPRGRVKPAFLYTQTGAAYRGSPTTGRRNCLKKALANRNQEQSRKTAIQGSAKEETDTTVN